MAVEHFLLSVSRSGVCVSASPPASPQLGNPDVCLPATSVSPQLRGLFFGSLGSGGCPAVRQPGEILTATIRVPGARLLRRPGHVASRRPVCAQPSVPLLRDSALATVQKRSSVAVSREMDSLGRGFRAAVWPSACSIRASRRAAGRLAFPAVRPSECPTFAAVGKAQQSALR